MLSAIILAAGHGRRLKTAVSKPLVKIGKFPAIAYSLAALNKHPAVDEIIVVVNSLNFQSISRLIRRQAFKKVQSLVLGGKRRQDSVYNGLEAVNSKSTRVLIHDSARPFIEQDTISKVIRAARKSGAAIVAVRPKATIKTAKKGNFVAQTLDRGRLWEVQTPQVFKKTLILKAYKKYAGREVTDDAALVEKLGADISVVEGSYRNIKITTVEDILSAGLIAKRFKYAI